MAYSLERLTDPQGAPITPAESDLAFYEPLGGMHGYAGVVPAHIKYWQKQRGVALDYGESAREGVANQILSWLTLDGAIQHPNDIVRMAGTSPDITPEVVEGYRRYVIGGLAMSLAIRRGLAVNFGDAIIDVRGLGNDIPSGSVSFDLSVQQDEREWPYEPRMHVALPPELSASLAEPGEDPLSGWSRFGTGLVVETRYPGDITPLHAARLQGHGAPNDPALHVTYLPHLLALQSPLR
jgi:hypothetical protein